MIFYCHNCHIQSNREELLPGYTCPSCQSGFIEEVSPHLMPSDVVVDASFRSADDYSDDNDSDAELPGGHHSSPLAPIFDFFQPANIEHRQPLPANTSMQRQDQQTQPSANQSGLNSSNPNESTLSAVAASATSSSGNNATTMTTTSSATTTPQQQRRITRSSARNRPPVQVHTSYFDNNSEQSLAEVLNDFITGASFGTQFPEGNPSASQGGTSGSSGSIPANRGLINIDFPIPFFLHSNPGDYAWGNAGFDAVITQLLNNLDGSNSGPPAMPKDQIDGLATLKIGDGHLKKEGDLQCTVCMDEFQLGDIARQLPCEHVFHQDCIIPWLNLVSRVLHILL